MGDLNLSRETKRGQALLSTSPLYAVTKIKRLAVAGAKDKGDGRKESQWEREQNEIHQQTKVSPIVES